MKEIKIDHYAWHVVVMCILLYILLNNCFVTGYWRKRVVVLICELKRTTLLNKIYFCPVVFIGYIQGVPILYRFYGSSINEPL